MHKLVGILSAVLMALLLAAPVPLAAAQYTDSAALDELFAQLKVAQSADEANDIANQIWTYWFNPDVPELADRMSKASVAMRNGDFGNALGVLSGIVKDYPDYAEGWNQRATLYYLLDNYDASLADIDRVLALEPRHFGALSGRVMIYLKQGKRDLALKDMVAALAIHPYLSEKALFPELAPNVTHV